MFTLHVFLWHEIKPGAYRSVIVSSLIEQRDRFLLGARFYCDLVKSLVMEARKIMLRQYSKWEKTAHLPCMKEMFIFLSLPGLGHL